LGVATALVVLAGILPLSGCGQDPLTQIPEPAEIEQPWLEPEGSGGPWNLLLITLDTTRRDHLGCYGYELPLTPFLDEIAQRGILFERAISAVPVTLPSHCTMLTGLNPQEHGVRNNGTFLLDSTQVTVAEVLSAAGYATGATLGAMPLDEEFGLGQGFDTYDDDFPEQIHGEDAVLERPATDVTELAATWIREHQSGPFFHWAHYYDPHFPYTPPPQFAQRFGFPYDGEIAYMDDELRRLFQVIDELDLLDNTWVLIVADHGESLGDHGEPAHGMFVYRATQDAPCILIPPRQWKGLPEQQTRNRRIEEVVALRDLAPTMINALGLEQDRLPCSGSSLLPLVAGTWTGPGVAYMETLVPFFDYEWSELRGIRSKRWTYVRAPEPELYDLEDDPQEQVNAIYQYPEVAQRLEAWCELFAGSSEKPLETQQIDPRTLERLRSLGYVASSIPEGSAVNDKDPKKRMHLVRKINQARNTIQSNPQSAIELLQSVLREEPQNSVALRFLARAQLTARQWEPAYGTARKIIARLPDDQDIQIYLIKAAAMTDRFDEAETLLDMAMEQDPDSRRLLRVQAELLAVQGQDEESRRILEKLIEGNPGDIEPLLHMARYEWTAGNLDRAAKLIEQILSQDPNVPGALAMRGELLWTDAQEMRQAGRREEAAAVLAETQRVMEHVLQLDRAEPVASFRLGVLAEIGGDLPRALQLYEQSLAREPNNPETHASIGGIYRAMQRPAEALRHLELAESLGLQSVSLLVNKGVIYATTGRLAEARAAWQAALALNPSEEIAVGIRRNLDMIKDQ